MLIMTNRPGGSMKRSLTVCLALLGGSSLAAEGPAPPSQPFKLGTFSRGGRAFIGMVLDDALVADLAAANAAFEARDRRAPKLALPGEMKELIARYETGGTKERLHAIASRVAGERAGSSRPAYIHDLKALKVLPPVRPETILNAAVNYTEHAAEMAPRPGAGPTPTPTPAPRSIPGLWERKPGDTRHNPYLFPKLPAAMIGEGEPIRLPPGRERVDWECELNAVIGKPASHVPIERARDYIFGYTLQNDVSDRAGRGDGRHGSDWLIGKSHDTFAPVGPFIVPKEFVPDPQKLAIKFTLSGKVMQDSNTDRMTHSVDEMVHYASNILTLKPGDLVSTGSPAGVGAGRAEPVFMKAGDVSVCTIERIGTLTNPVVGPSQPTSGR
jgi:2-keto-4-pentenoate hydratase/2-oxohepta-3-ene-1,7-dioic acid hydratase in catechol pathway